MMKKTIFIVLLLGVLMLAGCVADGEGWQNDVTYFGISFAKLKVEYTDAGEINYIRGYLKEPTTIQGYPCAEDWVTFSPDGKLFHFKTTAAIVILGNTIPTGSWITFNDNGSFRCVYPKEQLVQGYLCMGGGEYKGIHTSFYSDGALEYFYPPKAVTIQQIPCKGNTLMPLNIVGLHPNGTLKICTLAEDIELNGKAYKSGQQVEFTDQGTIIE